ncbi:ABC transporter permease, partial [Acidobacteriota bacterium]
SGLFVRRGLIVFQFTVTIILLVSTLVVYKQKQFMRNQHLSLSKDQVVSVRIRDTELMGQYETIKEDFRQNPHITGITVSSSLPSFPIAQRAYEPEGFDGNTLMVLTLYCDHDFIRTLGLEVIKGRDFSKAYSTDTMTAFIINEAAQRRFGWDDPLEKEITCGNTDEVPETATGKVIGVVKDFHFQSLHQQINPLILRIRPDQFRLLNIRVGGANISETLKYIEKNITARQPAHPFQYWFLDALFDSLYQNEIRLGRIFTAFSLIAVFIACLGLFGLAAFLAELRTKEIGIRKVLGASVGRITFLLSGEFIRWVLLSNLIAWPIAFYIMRKWLQNFPFRIDVSIWILILSGIGTLLVAFLTVCFQSIKAAVADPVNSLRYE